MKILLLNPPSPEGTQYVRIERCMQKKSAWAGSLWQPLPLTYAQSILKENGFETKLKDATAEEMGYRECLEFIKNENPDFLVVNTSIPTIKEDCEFTNEAKREIEKIKTIIVGMPPAIIPSIIESFNPDYAIIGDVEYAILDIVKGKIKHNKKTVFVEHFVEDLDKLPFPTLDDLDLDKYSLPFTKERLMLIDSGRGCPFNCAFCLVPPTSKGRVRYRDAKKFVDELERDYKQYNIKNFLFWIETATANKKFIKEICDEIIKRNLKIKWMTPSRVDTVDQEILNKMKEAGCWMLSYGMESTNQEVLDAIRKGTNLEQIKKAVEMAHKAGLKITAHIIIGLPKETKESVEKTLDWLIENKVDYCQFYCAVPYWKTDLRKIAEKNGWIESEDPKNYEIDKSVMRNESLSSKDIEELRRYCFKKFYFRPSIVLREIVAYKFNPFYIANLMKDGVYFFKTWVSAKSPSQ